MNQVLLAGTGYWDVTTTDYGKSFRRYKKDRPCKVVEHKGIRKNEVKVQFEDGTLGIIPIAGLRNRCFARIDIFVSYIEEADFWNVTALSYGDEDSEANPFGDGDMASTEQEAIEFAEQWAEFLAKCKNAVKITIFAKGKELLKAA